MTPLIKSVVLSAITTIAGGQALAGPIRDALEQRALKRQQEKATQNNSRDEPVGLTQDVLLERNLSYGSDPAQKLDVYRPKDARSAPVLVLVHGGAWVLGDKANANVVSGKVAHFVPRGFVVVSVNYRMERSAPDPLRQAEDVARALAFIQKHSDDWGADQDRILMIGHSSGAHLVALLTADPAISEKQGAKRWLGTVALDSAAYDVVQSMEKDHRAFYDKAFGTDRHYWEDASPYSRLSSAPLPMMLVCSTQSAGSCAQTDKFAAKAKSLGGKITVLKLDLTHADINAKIGASNDYTAQVEKFMRSVGLP